MISCCAATAGAAASTIPTAGRTGAPACVDRSMTTSARTTTAAASTASATTRKEPDRDRGSLDPARRDCRRPVHARSTAQAETRSAAEAGLRLRAPLGAARPGHERVPRAGLGGQVRYPPGAVHMPQVRRSGARAQSVRARDLGLNAKPPRARESQGGCPRVVSGSFCQPMGGVGRRFQRNPTVRRPLAHS